MLQVRNRGSVHSVVVSVRERAKDASHDRQPRSRLPRVPVGRLCGLRSVLRGTAGGRVRQRPWRWHGRRRRRQDPDGQLGCQGLSGRGRPFLAVHQRTRHGGPGTDRNHGHGAPGSRAGDRQTARSRGHSAQRRLLFR